MKKDQKTKAKKKDEMGELKEQLARALADYDNLRKRVEKEKEGYTQIANLSLVTKLLPIFDMLEEAQEQLKDSGLSIIIKEFLDVFSEEGIKRIDAGKGMGFNEELHEAVEVVDSPAGGKGKDGEIVEEVLSGWMYADGLVIRPAKVKVARK